MSTEEKKEPANRLCSEIQLFDLCDLDNCSFRKDRFCTDETLLTRFEAIREEDDQPLLAGDDDEDLDDDPDFADDYDDYDSDDYEDD